MVTPQPIVYADTSTVRTGRLADLEAATHDLAAFVQEHVPTVISYAFYLDAARETMTVVAVHPDPASLVLHMDTGRDRFRAFADLIELRRIDVYGAVTDEVRARLEAKAQTLGGATVTVHDLHAGFARPWLSS